MIRKLLEKLGLWEVTQKVVEETTKSIARRTGGAGKYYVSYLQDCGFGAGMHCHAVVVAENWQHCYDNYEDLIRKIGPYSVNDAYGNGPVACFYLQDQDEEDSVVMARFHDDELADQWIDPS